LMEEGYPHRFVPIFRGQVEDVRFERGRVRLVITPLKYKLETALASTDRPVGLGKLINTPAVLVDAATGKYRVNTELTSEVATAFVLRDDGVVVADPTDGAPDYSYVLEDEDLNEDVGGAFRGKMQLTGGSPTGKLTADQNYLNVAAQSNF